MNTTEKTLSQLFEAAKSINDFSEKFTLERRNPHHRDYSDQSIELAHVWSFVCDDTGSIEPSDAPEGNVRLTVDIERFREFDINSARGRKKVYDADDAENEVITFCKKLGFKVELSTNVGNGQYGVVNQLALT